MIASIADPTALLMMTHLGVDPDGRIRSGLPNDLRRSQRRYQRRSRLRKLLG